MSKNGSSVPPDAPAQPDIGDPKAAGQRRPSSQALYRQVKNYVLKKIQSGEWPTDARIPSENGLVELFGVSRMTVNRALRELTNDGHLMRVQGVGTFVARPKPQATLLEIKSIDREIAQWGGRHSCRVHLLAEEKATARVGKAMDLKTGAPVFHSIIIHYDKDRPVMLSDRYVNPAIAPQYLEQDFTITNPSDYLLAVAPLQEVEHVIEAVMPDKKLIEMLGMKENEPCLLLNRRTWAFEVVATSSRLYYPGSRYRLGARFKSKSSDMPPIA